VTRENGFAPISGPNARVLVLGSMPGRRSLDEHQYYGNPHNGFWRIMSQFTGVDGASDYKTKVDGLVRTRIAVWDVIKSCVRPGSLDADIENSSIEVNDFDKFFAQYNQIRAVFFNGGRAAREYSRRVIPILDQDSAAIPTAQLLSTSPANARYSLDEKRRNWEALRQFLTHDKGGSRKTVVPTGVVLRVAEFVHSVNDYVQIL